MNKEELIQDYIANRLSDAEIAQAESLLKTDAEFQELYETHLELTAAFKISNEKALKKRLQALDTIDTTKITETPQQKSKNTFTLVRRLAIAAILIVGAFIAVNQFVAQGDIFDSYFEVCPNTYLPVTRGTTNEDATFEAFKAYESGTYDQAALAFKQLLATDNNPNIRFYYAMSLLNQEKLTVALNELNAISNQTFDYQSESLWYAALIHIKKDNSAAAKTQLETLQNINPAYKSVKIQDILAKL
ncbi:MAG: hypothetical protein AAF617_01760 [Bacteroidota bacterium]